MGRRLLYTNAVVLLLFAVALSSNIVERSAAVEVPMTDIIDSCVTGYVNEIGAQVKGKYEEMQTGFVNRLLHGDNGYNNLVDTFNGIMDRFESDAQESKILIALVCRPQHLDETNNFYANEDSVIRPQYCSTVYIRASVCLAENYANYESAFNTAIGEFKGAGLDATEPTCFKQSKQNYLSEMRRPWSRTGNCGTWAGSALCKQLALCDNLDRLKSIPSQRPDLNPNLTYVKELAAMAVDSADGVTTPYGNCTCSIGSDYISYSDRSVQDIVATYSVCDSILCATCFPETYTGFSGQGKELLLNVDFQNDLDQTDSSNKDSINAEMYALVFEFCGFSAAAPIDENNPLGLDCNHAIPGYSKTSPNSKARYSLGESVCGQYDIAAMEAVESNRYIEFYTAGGVLAALVLIYFGLAGSPFYIMVAITTFDMMSNWAFVAISLQSGRFIVQYDDYDSFYAATIAFSVIQTLSTVYLLYMALVDGEDEKEVAEVREHLESFNILGLFLWDIPLAVLAMLYTVTVGDSDAAAIISLVVSLLEIVWDLLCLAHFSGLGCFGLFEAGFLASYFASVAVLQSAVTAV
eukprot:UC1_evm1s1078